MVLWSCSPSPKPIEYGSDACHFCKMTIVDAKYGAEAVSSKGKVYLFDAIECKLQFMQQKANTEFAHLLVNTFDQPKQLVDATIAHYLISPALPSPMGANLTAFANATTAQHVHQEKGGDLMQWNDLLDYFSNKGSDYYVK